MTKKEETKKPVKKKSSGIIMPPDAIAKCQLPPGATPNNPAPLGYVSGTNIPRTREKVVICGFAPSSMADAKMFFGNPEYEIWTLNQIYMPFPAMATNATRWFQIHHRHSYDQSINRDHSHHEWLAKQTLFPIYMQDQQPDIQCSAKFPKDEIMSHFGNYFTNTISWMVALAIMEGFKEIQLYGVDMAQDGEYSYERPSVEFFLGWARGAGIHLVLPEKCDLLKTLWLYPFDDSAPFRAKVTARRQELRQRMAEMSSQEQQSHDSRMQLIGALDNMNYVEKSWENSAREIAVTGGGQPPLH